MKKNKKAKEKWADDGRTISNMNIKGMPWYKMRVPKGERLHAPVMTKKERRAAVFGGIRAILPFVLLYAVVMFGLLLILTYVWL